LGVDEVNWERSRRRVGIWGVAWEERLFW